MECIRTWSTLCWKERAHDRYRFLKSALLIIYKDFIKDWVEKALIKNIYAGISTSRPPALKAKADGGCLSSKLGRKLFTQFNNDAVQVFTSAKMITVILVLMVMIKVSFLCGHCYVYDPLYNVTNMYSRFKKQLIEDLDCDLDTVLVVSYGYMTQKMLCSKLCLYQETASRMKWRHTTKDDTRDKTPDFYKDFCMNFVLNAASPNGVC
ncbi:hypothetical protein BCR42DRAFT_497160 [Absidia repens]|uniref:Uncharacterized protein n=1 Tax=Absidia repens TaxID=90262 RepID=A0A1X2HRG0_9FUNG|nr:hypothetical protein BCR42DRAFT_497160 [Absidia repens]